MIQFRFYKNGTDNSLHMEVTGDAGAEQISAAVTMLVYTAAQAVQFMHSHGMLKKPPRIVLTDGSFTVAATPAHETEAETMMVFWVAQVGAHVLSVNYPEYVKLDPMNI